MKTRIECPYGEGQAVLKKDIQVITYRKEEFHVVAHYYVCEDCGEEFTNNEADYLTLIQAHNQYREKYGIPFPEEIKAIREKYKLSALKMSEVLKLGENGYANYEKGEIPSPAIGNLIKAAEKPDNFLDFLIKSKNSFNNDNAYKKALDHVQLLAEKEKKQYSFFSLLNNYTDPGNFTGYNVLSESKIEQLLIFFITHCASVYNDKLKLNKLLFYTDFRHYRYYGKSVSGLSYCSQPFGPVPVCYDHIFTYFEQQHSIYPFWMEINNGGAREIVKTKHQGGESVLFNEQEKETIDFIVDTFKDTSTWDLVKKSFELKFNADGLNSGQLIGYQDYAFAMNDF